MIASTSLPPTTAASTATLTSQPDVVADRVLRRAELGKLARRLQNRLALAQFKTRHGWEDLTLDMIEPKYEDEIRRKRGSEGCDVLSDSSSSTSEHAYPYPPSAGRQLMSSPLKAPLFSDAIGSSNGSTGHRKRTYMASFDDLNQAYRHQSHSQTAGRRASYMVSSPSKRYRSSPPPPSSSAAARRHVSGPVAASGGGFDPQRAFLPPPPPPAASSSSFTGHASWKDHHQLSHSSPIKPRRQQHFTTAAGPDVSLFPGARRIADALSVNANYNAAQSDDDDELLPTHSFRASDMSFGPPPPGLPSTVSRMGGSPPTTPPMRSRGLPNGNSRRKKKAAAGAVDEAGESNHHMGLGIDHIDELGNSTGDNSSNSNNNNNNNNSGSNNTNNGAQGKSVEGADLLLFLAASPSPANPSGTRSSRMDPPSTPPSKFNSLALPSSMMTTPGGGSMFPNTPGQAFDFADFVNITPSPAQKPWKTPNLLGSKTPLSVARRRLTFDDPL